MRSRYCIIDATDIYFLTNAIVEWMPDFTRQREYDLVTAPLALCRAQKGLRV